MRKGRCPSCGLVSSLSGVVRHAKAQHGIRVVFPAPKKDVTERTQKPRVYGAEQELWSKLGASVMNPRTCKDFVDRVCRVLGEAPIRVTVTGRRVRGTAADACGAKNTIRVHESGERDWILLHEIAHVLNYRWKNGKGHEPGWCRIYLDLLRRFMGDWTAELLRKQFEALNVGVDS